MIQKLLIPTSATALAAVAVFSLPTEAVSAQSSILDELKAAGNYNTLVLALETAGLDAALDSNMAELTLFAPTDDAFAQIPSQDLQDLLNNIPALTDVLLYHVIGEALLDTDVVALSAIETLNGQRVDVDVQGTDVFIDQAKIEVVNTIARNGVIHQIDGVLFPSFLNIVETAAADGNFTSLLAAAGLLPNLANRLQNGGPFTVFAPVDSAFAAIPPERLAELLKGTGASNKVLRKILKAHVVGRRFFSNDVVGLTEITTINGIKLPIQVVGSDVFVGGVRLIAADVDASNGVIHVVENVIVP